MPWKLVAGSLVLALSAPAAIWPPNIDPYQRKSAAPVALGEQAEVWQEYGFAEGETAVYENGAKKLTATAWRFNDSTGPMAAFYWQAPAESKPIPFLKNSLAGKGVTLAAVGNYLMRFEGTYRPSANEILFWGEHFPSFRERSLPALPRFIPENASSIRYITGPKSLKAFLGDLPEAAAAFHFGTEIALVKLPTATGEVRAAIAGFPNHAMARQQLPHFQQYAGQNARRSGALVITALPPVPADAAPVLDKIKYDSLVDFSETAPTQMPNVGGLLIGTFRLVGFLILIGAGSGGFVALLLYLSRGRERKEPLNAVMTRLNLD